MATKKKAVKKAVRKAKKTAATEPFVITAKYLEKIGACESEVEIFAEAFPKGLPVTKKGIAKYNKWQSKCFIRYSIDWLADRLPKRTPEEELLDCKRWPKDEEEAEDNLWS